MFWTRQYDSSVHVFVEEYIHEFLTALLDGGKWSASRSATSLFGESAPSTHPVDSEADWRWWPGDARVLRSSASLSRSLAYFLSQDNSEKGEKHSFQEQDFQLGLPCEDSVCNLSARRQVLASWTERTTSAESQNILFCGSVFVLKTDGLFG